MPSLDLIGYWATPSAEGPRYPDPHDLIRRGEPPADLDRIVEYLRGGVEIRMYRGFSTCRFEGGPPDHEMGSRELSDGTWAWPEGLWVYVSQFRVTLPPEFESHVRANGYKVPEVDPTPLRTAALNPTIWLSWAKSYASKAPATG